LLENKLEDDGNLYWNAKKRKLSHLLGVRRITAFAFVVERHVFYYYNESTQYSASPVTENKETV